ncbi:hypothetical protein [Vibrio phage V-YDF132]|nr:hypothetical protein [Vibrio phage V-YDF132]
MNVSIPFEVNQYMLKVIVCRMLDDDIFTTLNNIDQELRETVPCFGNFHPTQEQREEHYQMAVNGLTKKRVRECLRTTLKNSGVFYFESFEMQPSYGVKKEDIEALAESYVATYFAEV